MARYVEGKSRQRDAVEAERTECIQVRVSIYVERS